MKKPWPTTKEGKPWPTCCLCGGPVEPWHEDSKCFGHNPAPLSEEGKCCTDCNYAFVLPARVARLKTFDQYWKEDQDG